jgi:hypothetical protein
VKHPMQKIVIASDGAIRFASNKIVETLLEKWPGGLNDLAVRFHKNREDYEQLTMLIGYSVSGFGDLSTSSRGRVRSADRAARRINDAKQKGAR